MIFRNVNQLRQCDLDKDLMIGIEAQQTLIQRLLPLSQQIARRDGPCSVREGLTEMRLRTGAPIHYSPQSS